MAVLTVGSIFSCEICGNEVIVTKGGNGTLVCCQEDMKRINEHHDYDADIEEDLEERDEDEE